MSVQRYTVNNETFFDSIDTEEKAYYLGLMGADGYVATKDKVMGIGLSGEQDKPLLEKLQCLLGTTYPIKRESPRGSAKLPSFKLCVRNERLRADLIRHGVVPNKTSLYQFNTSIDPSLVRHYIRGYLDGDGSISLLTKGGTNVSIVSSIPFVEHLARVVAQQIGCKGSVYIRPGKTYGQFSLSGPFACFLLLDWLYANCTVSMDRKRAQYERCKALAQYKVTHPSSFYPRHTTSRVMRMVEACCARLGVIFDAACYQGLSVPEDEQAQIVGLHTAQVTIDAIAQHFKRSKALVQKVIDRYRPVVCTL
jgi:hypothetical protein